MLRSYTTSTSPSSSTLLNPLSSLTWPSTRNSFASRHYIQTPYPEYHPVSIHFPRNVSTQIVDHLTAHDSSPGRSLPIGNTIVRRLHSPSARHSSRSSRSQLCVWHHRPHLPPSSTSDTLRHIWHIAIMIPILSIWQAIICLNQRIPLRCFLLCTNFIENLRILGLSALNEVLIYSFINELIRYWTPVIRKNIVNVLILIVYSESTRKN